MLSRSSKLSGDAGSLWGAWLRSLGVGARKAWVLEAKRRRRRRMGFMEQSGGGRGEWEGRPVLLRG